MIGSSLDPVGDLRPKDSAVAWTPRHARWWTAFKSMSPVDQDKSARFRGWKIPKSPAERGEWIKRKRKQTCKPQPRKTRPQPDAPDLQELLDDLKRLQEDFRRTQEQREREQQRRPKNLGEALAMFPVFTAAKALGFEQPFDLTESEIKAAWKQRAAQTHPDREGNADDFIRVTHARDTLLTFIAGDL